MAGRKTRNELLEDLRRKQEELGRDPDLEDIRDDVTMANQTDYRREFGSLRKALEQLKKSESKLSEKDFASAEERRLTRALVAEADKLGRIPSRMEIDHLSTVESYKKCEEIYGSYRAIVAKIKHFRPNISSKYTKENLVGDLRLLAKESGRTISLATLRKDDRMSFHAIYEFFDGPEDALAEVGLTLIAKRRGNPIQQKTVIAGMQALAKQYGHQPVMREVDADPNLPAALVVKKILGCQSWPEVLKISGVDDLPSGKRTRNPHSICSPEERREKALADLRQLAEKLGRIPTYKDIHIHMSAGAPVTYTKLFGGVQKAAEVAGLKSEQKSEQDHQKVP